MTLHETLNERIADFAVLYFKLHRYHWFVKGPDFYPLHALYQELYEEATGLLDEYAERLLAIGGTPVATMSGYLGISKLKEDGTATDNQGIFKALIEDYTTITEALKAGISTAQEAGDESTADLFIGTITGMEKHLWMFKQSLSAK